MERKYVAIIHVLLFGIIFVLITPCLLEHYTPDEYIAPFQRYFIIKEIDDRILVDDEYTIIYDISTMQRYGDIYTIWFWFEGDSGDWRIGYVHERSKIFYNRKTTEIQVEYWCIICDEHIHYNKYKR